MWGYSGGLPLMEETPPDIPAVAATAGADALAALSEVSMRCGGCGAKVGATVLSRVMAKLQGTLETRPDVVLVGLESPDDMSIYGNNCLITSILLLP